MICAHLRFPTAGSAGREKQARRGRSTQKDCRGTSTNLCSQNCSGSPGRGRITTGSDDQDAECTLQSRAAWGPLATSVDQQPCLLAALVVCGVGGTTVTPGTGTNITVSRSPLCRLQSLFSWGCLFWSSELELYWFLFETQTFSELVFMLIVSYARKGNQTQQNSPRLIDSKRCLVRSWFCSVHFNFFFFFKT